MPTSCASAQVAAASREYEDNFGEKKNFLKTLIFLIYIGEKAPDDVEELVVNQVIVEYYEAYFHPFEKFTEQERKDIIHLLTLKHKMNGEYDKFEEELEKKYAEQEKEEQQTPKPTEEPEETLSDEEKERREKEGKGAQGKGEETPLGGETAEPGQ